MGGSIIGCVLQTVPRRIGLPLRSSFFEAQAENQPPKLFTASGVVNQRFSADRKTLCTRRVHHSPLHVVEDNEDHFLLLEHALKKAAVSNPIRWSKTGEDAVAYLSAGGQYSNLAEFPVPALVLLDLNLPGRSGFDVLKWIRRHPGLKVLRVVVLTSSELDKEIQMAYEFGANAFLTKPVDLETLVEMVKVLQAHWLKFAQAPGVFRTHLI